MKYIYILQILLLCSCANNQLVKETEQFKDKQITFSSNMQAILEGKDTVVIGFTEISIKLMVWYDSLGCTACNASRMYEWDDIVAYADSLSPWFRIVFLFTPKEEDLHGVMMALQREQFDYPIFIDQNATFVKQNPKLPKNRHLHSFLLDKENKVVLVGNPLHNPSLWKLYQRTIQTMIDNDGVLPK